LELRNITQNKLIDFIYIIQILTPDAQTVNETTSNQYNDKLIF